MQCRSKEKDRTKDEAELGLEKFGRERKKGRERGREEEESKVGVLEKK